MNNPISNQINKDKINIERDEKRIEKGIEKGLENKTDDDINTNVLSGDNKVDVDIEPDVKQNRTIVQLCSFSFNCICNCFSRESK